MLVDACIRWYWLPLFHSVVHMSGDISRFWQTVKRAHASKWPSLVVISLYRSYALISNSTNTRADERTSAREHSRREHHMHNTFSHWPLKWWAPLIPLLLLEQIQHKMPNRFETDDRLSIGRLSFYLLISMILFVSFIRIAFVSIWNSFSPLYPVVKNADPIITIGLSIHATKPEKLHSRAICLSLLLVLFFCFLFLRFCFYFSFGHCACVSWLLFWIGNVAPATDCVRSWNSYTFFFLPYCVRVRFGLHRTFQ